MPEAIAFKVGGYRYIKSVFQYSRGRAEGVAAVEAHLRAARELLI